MTKMIYGSPERDAEKKGIDRYNADPFYYNQLAGLPFLLVMLFVAISFVLVFYGLSFIFPGLKEMFVSAKIFPRNAVLSPRVAWPTTQYTPAAAAPAPPVVSVTITDASLPVVNVVPVSKIQSGERLPPAARVSAPVN